MSAKKESEITINGTLNVSKEHWQYLWNIERIDEKLKVYIEQKKPRNIERMMLHIKWSDRTSKDSIEELFEFNMVDRTPLQLIDLLLEKGKKRNVFCRINKFVSIDIKQIMFDAAIKISIESIKNYRNIQRILPLIYDHSLLKLLGWVTYIVWTTNRIDIDMGTF